MAPFVFAMPSIQGVSVGEEQRRADGGAAHHGVLGVADGEPGLAVLLLADDGDVRAALLLADALDERDELGEPVAEVEACGEHRLALGHVDEADPGLAVQPREVLEELQEDGRDREALAALALHHLLEVLAERRGERLHLGIGDHLAERRLAEARTERADLLEAREREGARGHEVLEQDRHDGFGCGRTSAERARDRRHREEHTSKGHQDLPGRTRRPDGGRGYPKRPAAPGALPTPSRGSSPWPRCRGGGCGTG